MLNLLTFKNCFLIININEFSKINIVKKIILIVIFILVIITLIIQEIFIMLCLFQLNLKLKELH